MFWILIYIISFLLILYEIQFRWKYRSLNRFPGPLSLPFLGSSYYILYLKSVMGILNYMTEHFGSIVKFQIGHHMILLISDTDMLEFFLRSQKFVDKSDQYQYLAPWLGKNGLFIAERIEWFKKRKLYTPAFNLSFFEEALDVFSPQADVLVDVLGEVADSSPVNIYPKIKNYTLDVIAETALGIKTNCQRNCNKEYLLAKQYLAKSIMTRTVSLWKRFDFLYKLSADYKTEKKCLKVVSDMSDKAIENRRKILRGSEKLSEETDSHTDGEKKNTAGIDFLLTSTIDGKPFPDDVLRTEVNSIVAGGYDTTASAISIMIYALASHKEVQDKVVEELKNIFGNDRDRPATMKDIGEMRYLELVIKESMRFYPLVPFIARKMTEDVDYKGTIIPKGTTLLFFIHGVHTSSLYDRPEEFIPERFLPTNDIKPYTFLPFSAGPRNCLGQKYAMIEIKATFSKLLRHFEFESSGPHYKMELEPYIVMKPVNGIYVNIKPRIF